MLSLRLRSLNTNGPRAYRQEGGHGYFARRIRTKRVAIDQTIAFAEVGELDAAIGTGFHLELLARDGVFFHRGNHHAPDALLLFFPVRAFFLLALVLTSEHGRAGQVGGVHFLPILRDAQLPGVGHESFLLGFGDIGRVRWRRRQVATPELLKPPPTHPTSVGMANSHESNHFRAWCQTHKSSVRSRTWIKPNIIAEASSNP